MKQYSIPMIGIGIAITMLGLGGRLRNPSDIQNYTRATRHSDQWGVPPIKDPEHFARFVQVSSTILLVLGLLVILIGVASNFITD